MSLYIEVDSVTEVLLADGWHGVINSSFDIDSYEFHNEKLLLLAGGSCEGVVSTGASWEEDTGKGGTCVVSCPLTSILAVREGFKP